MRKCGCDFFWSSMSTSTTMFLGHHVVCLACRHVCILNTFFTSYLRWSSLKRESTRRPWTPCFTRQCLFPTTLCWRPRGGATPAADLTVRKRRGPGERSFASVSVESTSRGTARTKSGPWDTEAREHERLDRFHIDGEHSEMESDDPHTFLLWIVFFTTI